MSETPFDFTAMQAQGAAAGIPVLYVLTMTPLPLAPDTVAQTPPDEPTPLESHYAYMHQMIEKGKILLIGPCMSEPTMPGQAPVPPGIGILRVTSQRRSRRDRRQRAVPRYGLATQHFQSFD